jgi:hypothetical protein
MAIQMTREEMLADLELVWQGIMKLDPASQIDLAEARDVWAATPDDRLEITYNQSRAHLWRLVKQT